MSDQPGPLDPRVERARALHESGAFQAAADLYAEILGARPELYEFWRRIGVDALEQGDLDAAVTILERTAARAKPARDTHHALARALRARGDLAGAINHCRRALDLEPRDAAGRVHLAECLLAAGRFAEGFREFEWRRRLPEVAMPRPPEGLPPWDGADPAGQKILVAAEQGFGDTLQFCRFLTVLAARGARPVLAVPPPLHGLMESLAGLERVISRDADLPADCDAWAPLLSLPHLLGLDDVAVDGAYLQAAPAVGADPTRDLRVGVAWQGRVGAKAAKSAPFELIAALGESPGVRLVGLQKGPAAADAANLAPETFVDGVAQCEDFAATAGVMAHLDLVVAADTAVAHLAGALGLPVWVALGHNPDWRWMRGRDASPWYPTARLFRQTRPGDWADVFHRLGAELAARAG